LFSSYNIIISDVAKASTLKAKAWTFEAKAVDTKAKALKHTIVPGLKDHIGPRH